MGLFTRRRPPLVLAPEAVAALLRGAGFAAAEKDAAGRLCTEGFETWITPVSHEDRVSVDWHVFWDADDPREIEATLLVAMSSVLEQHGYQTEIVDEMMASYLVVWAKGEF